VKYVKLSLCTKARKSRYTDTTVINKNMYFLLQIKHEKVCFLVLGIRVSLVKWLQPFVITALFSLWTNFSITVTVTVTKRLEATVVYFIWPDWCSSISSKYCHYLSSSHRIKKNLLCLMALSILFNRYNMSVHVWTHYWSMVCAWTVSNKHTSSNTICLLTYLFITLFKLFSRSKTPHTLITEDAMIDTTKYGTVRVHYSGNW